MVYEVISEADFTSKLEEAGDKLVVVDFYATWCKACMTIAPKIQEMSETIPEVVFLKVDIDKLDDLAKTYGVHGIPHFVFIKKQERIDTFIGARAEKVKSLIDEHKNIMSSDEPTTKVPKTTLHIGTHNGTFHCDEVFACFLLKQLNLYKDAEIIRTRDHKILDTCDIVVDVGDVFDPEKKRFDHHQRSFHETMKSLKPGKPWVTKLSSAGLVYLYYGEDVISSILKKPKGDDVVQMVYDKVYEGFIQEIDAVDNGISTHDGEPRYRITSNLSSRVSFYNPAWNDTDKDETNGFYKAMRLIRGEFIETVNYFGNVWWPARELVVHAINERNKLDPDGQIIELPSGGCPWKEHLFALEKELKIGKPILYAIFEDGNKAWRIQCVPVEAGSFTNRMSLHKDWCGLRDEALSKVSGIPDCIFVHANGFIGGNKTKEGVVTMAQKTIKAAK